MQLRLLVTSRPYHRLDSEVERSSRETMIRLKWEEEVNAITAHVNRVLDAGIKQLESIRGEPEDWNTSTISSNCPRPDIPLGFSHPRDPEDWSARLAGGVC